MTPTCDSRLTASLLGKTRLMGQPDFSTYALRKVMLSILQRFVNPLMILCPVQVLRVSIS